MLRVNIYLTDELNKEIERQALISKKSKAEVVREALEKGLKKAQPKSAQALLDFAKAAEKIPTKGKLPKDLIENMDYYTWGGDKSGQNGGRGC